ncbi:ArsR/SmtB family transcription factor [Senegalia massiliensis]|uniref:ArsR family transcriptional regulator n=1 Tax=Senegalia massiliensis TaxID=1720316 RepID=A0A845QWD9_9CLOT|nr:metalloregulator ArsR/SmtB family transcription factor [Senegalia massiliensis]NBI05482.1 ArsR family transcriptional regulator [Senegalia massiliensis]
MDLGKKDIFDKKSEILKSLAHPIRLCIVHGLMEQEGRNVSTIQSCLNAPQSTISQHLAKLKAAGIIEGKRNGTEINYYVIDEDAKKIISSIIK